MQYYGDLLRRMTNSSKTDVCEFFVKKCLTNAKYKSTNEGMKRFFMICAVSANDGIRGFLDDNELKSDGYWAHRKYFSKIKDGVPLVVKSYLSCMLLLLGKQKKLIHKKTGMNEAELLSIWCTIFKYDDSDKQYFNELVKKLQFGEEGLRMVFAGLNDICHEKLNGGVESNLPCNDENRDRLLYRVGQDVYILVQRLHEMPDFVA